MKEKFESQLKEFVLGLQKHISTEDGQWTVKGFIDVFQNIYTLSSDTKIVSKILEIHLFPKIMEFAQKYGYKIVLAEHQNYYPDISFVKADDETIKYAVDFKTTYRNPNKPFLCNGFTLGSHGKYFEDRTSTKNIQFPYSEYSGHFCLGIIYDRTDGASIDETKSYNISELYSIASVVSGFHFFVKIHFLVRHNQQKQPEDSALPWLQYLYRYFLELPFLLLFQYEIAQACYL